MRDPTRDEMIAFLKANVDEKDTTAQEVEAVIYAYAVARLVLVTGTGKTTTPNLKRAVVLSRFTPPAYYTGLDGEQEIHMYSLLSAEYGEP